MDAGGVVSGIGTVTLRRVAEAALGAPVLEAAATECRSIYRPRVLATRGVYQVAGTARTPGAVSKTPPRDATWEAVLKVLAPAADGALPFEAALYTSGFLAALPGPLGAPRCYAVTRLATGEVGVWLEQVRGDAGAAWPLAGGGKGCSAQLALLLEPGSSAAALANSSTPAAHRLALGAANALAGLAPDAPLAPLRSLPEHAAEAKTLARLTGTYRWHDDEEGIAFELRHGALDARVRGQSHECRMFAAHGLVVCGPGLTVRFLLDAAGDAWGLSDGARVWRRVS